MPTQKFNSIKFGTDTDATACNGRGTPANNVGGSISATKYEMAIVSGVQGNIVKAAFNEPAGDYHGDFYQAFDPVLRDNPSNLNRVGFNVDVFDPQTNGRFTVKQLDENGEVSAIGYMMRWVPGDASSESVAFIQVASGDFLSPDNDPTAGVIFCDFSENGITDAKTAWGSSIKEIYDVEDAYQITTEQSVNGGDDELTNEPTTGYGEVAGTGVLTPIVIRKLTYNGTGYSSTIVTVARGYVFATLASGSNQYILRIHLTSFENGFSSIPASGTSGYGNGEYQIQSDDSLDNPCFRYTIAGAERLDTDQNPVRRIEFRESGLSQSSISFDPTDDNKAYQYRWDDFDGSTAKISYATILSWVPSQSALYVQECDSDEPLKKEYGPIFQSTTAGLAVWGNKGFTNNTNFTKKSGRFVNIKHSNSNKWTTGKDFTANWNDGGENLVQTLSRGVTYIEGTDYIVGEKVYQVGSTDLSDDYGYASATVVSWEHPDPTDPTDTSPMKLVARIDRFGPDQPGNFIDADPFQALATFQVGESSLAGSLGFSGKILPQRILNSFSESTSWPYEVVGENVFFTDKKNGVVIGGTTTYPLQSHIPVTSTIGTTRIRAVSPGPAPQSGETGPLFKFFLIDTELTEADAAFGNISSIVYSDGSTNKVVAEIAEVSGRVEITEAYPGSSQTTTAKKTVIYDPSKNKMIFVLPTGNVFEDVIASDTLSVQIQKIFNLPFSAKNNSLTISGSPNDDAQIIVASSPLANSKFLLSDANVNWFAVDSSTGAILTLVSGVDADDLSDNEVLFAIPSGETDTPSKLTLTVGTSSGITNVTLFTKMLVTFTQDNIRTKTIQSQKETIYGLLRGTSGKLKDQYYATLMSEVSRGQIRDIKAIYTVTGSNQIINGTANLVDIFTLDAGTTDQKIARPRIIVNPGAVKANGKLDGRYFGPEGTADVDPASVILEVTYEYYELGVVDIGSAGIMCRESYKDANGTTLSVDKLPYYVSQNDGQIVHESAIIDFRPLNLESDNDFDLGNTKIVPHPDWADTISVSFYLPRRDKLILNQNGALEVLYGQPSLTPTYPPDKPQAMTLYLLDKDAFVFEPSNITPTMVDNRRFTMRDIGRIEKRVQRLETYATLSALEKKADDMLVLDAEGNNRFKNGILVDNFDGHKIGDVVHPDYNCAMDFDTGTLRPPFKTHRSSLLDDNSQVIGNKFIASGASGIYTFPYTTDVLAAQPLATRAITVQPHEVIQFEGQVVLSPSMDNWVDVTERPDVMVNLAGENDAWNMMVAAINNNDLAPFGTQWGEWETLSRTGVSTEVVDRSVDRDVVSGWRNVNRTRGRRRQTRDVSVTTTTTSRVNETLQQIRQSMNRTLATSTTDVSLGDRIVDIGVLPFIRATTIKISVAGMKPTTRIYIYFDGVNVSEFCTKYSTLEDLNAGTNGVSFATGTTAQLKTNSDGTLYAEFALPGATFRTGDRKLEISDDPQNVRTRATTYAAAVYSASGLRAERETTIATTRSFQINEVAGESESRTIQNSELVTSTSTEQRTQTRIWDPLAQTFFVNPDLHPEGIFLESVDLFFARKPENSTNIPVEIQIRPVINGYPDSNVIIPGSRVVKLPSEVNVSDTPDANDPSTKTNFKFAYPIHLAPGEHSIVIKGQTSEYEVYIATLGDFVLGTETKVTNQPYVGVFFTSANASTWSADQNSDLTMILNKCVFATNVSYTMALVNESINEERSFELFNLNGASFDFNSCRASWEVEMLPKSNQFGNSTTLISVQPNQNIPLDKSYVYGLRTNGTVVPLNVRVTAQTSNQDVAPIIDLDGMGFFAVQNLIENNDATGNGELLPYIPAGSVGNTARVRYISRVVTLEDGFDCNNFKCALLVNKPANSNIQVFVKVQDSHSTDEFHSSPWLPLAANVENFDSWYTNGPNDYRDVEFSLSQDTSTPFNKFCVKICLYSPDPANIPTVKEMRGIGVL